MTCNVALFFDIFAKNLKKPFVFLVRKRALGDVLWIEPVIRSLAFKTRKVIVYTKYPELFANYPLPNVVIKSELNFMEKVLWGIERWLKSSFFFVNLEGAYEEDPNVHFLTAYQRKAGVPVIHEYPKIYLSQKEVAWNPPVEGKYVVLHLESLTDRNYRRVYGIEWDKVAASLIERGFKVVLAGKDPMPVAGAFHIRTSIREMMVLIKKAAFVIGIDSGPSHIASVLGVPSLIFFGAVNPSYRHFMELFKGRILQQYCEYAGCYHDTAYERWPQCKLVGDEGIPKCSLHTTGYVLENIDLLIKDYQIT